MYKLGIIGVGNMGGAILRGVLESKNLDPSEIIMFERNKDKIKDLLDKGVSLGKSEEEVFNDSENILLSIKPQSFKELGKKISGKISDEKVLISIAAGVSLDQMKEFFSHEKNIRIMPNTPALIGRGMSAIVPSESISDDERTFVEEIFKSVGEVTTTIDEKKIDAYSAVAGCMPAFVYMFIEAAADAGVKNGLKRDEAYKYVSQAVMGSAEMVLKTGKHPGELKDQVTSPGGTTIRGVVSLEKNGFRNAVIEGVDESANAKIDL